MLMKFLRWLSGGDQQYMPSVHCLNHDTLWIWINVIFNLLVFAGYWIIAADWRRRRKRLARSPAFFAFGYLTWIFVLCGTSYLLTAVRFVWPVWRLAPLPMLLLIVATYRYVFHIHGLETIEKEFKQADDNKVELHLFKQLADTVPHLVWMARGDGYIFWYNERWYEYTGTTAKEMEGWGWKKVHDPAFLSTVLEAWGKSLKTGAEFDMTFPLKGRSGFRWFLTRVIPLKDDHGQVTMWYGTNTDVDSQYRQINDFKQRSDESMERLQVLTDKLGQSLVVPVPEEITPVDPNVTAIIPKIIPVIQEVLYNKSREVT